MPADLGSTRACRRRTAAPSAPTSCSLHRWPTLQAAARRVRDAGPRQPGHLLAQGLHPADHAVPRPLRLLHLRQGPGPARVARTSSIDEVLAIARAGRAAGCHEALFTLGEGPEDRYPAARRWLSEHGYASTVDYLVAACRAVVEETGLLPHANAGALDGRGPGPAPAGVRPARG